jgi:hypothetical protein
LVSFQRLITFPFLFLFYQNHFLCKFEIILVILMLPGCYIHFTFVVFYPIPVLFVFPLNLILPSFYRLDFRPLTIRLHFYLLQLLLHPLQWYFNLLALLPQLFRHLSNLHVFSFVCCISIRSFLVQTLVLVFNHGHVLHNLSDSFVILDFFIPQLLHLALALTDF